MKWLNTEFGPSPAGDVPFDLRRLASCLALAFVLVMALFVVGCQSSAPPPVFPGAALYDARPQLPSDEPGVANYAKNLLQEGDVVSITFQYSTNFDAVQKITLDGLLNLESIGTVKAAGKTPLELQAEIAKMYKPQTQDDTVTVKLISAVASVYVSGAVFRPGKVTMERPMTALEAVMEAGGFDPTRAKLSDAVVLRLENGKQHAYHVNLRRVLQGDEETPFYLRPFDIVHVPAKTFNF